MRNRFPFVLFVWQRIDRPLLTIWALAHGLVPPANRTSSQPCQTSFLVSQIEQVGEHKCPNYYKEGGQGSRYFCPVCKLNTKLCMAPTNHTQSFIPETFVDHAARLDYEEAGQAATWSHHCINKGSLGSASLLTSSLTLINGDDTIQVKALWDAGSESSFFLAALLPFAVSQRD